MRTLDIPEARSCLALCEQIQKAIDAAKERIEADTTDHPVPELLMSVPGIGAYTSFLILAEVGDFTRFEDDDHIGGYAGLAPGLHQSGDTNWKGPITKQGNLVLRWALVEAARNYSWLCLASTLSSRHRRIMKKNGSGRTVVATARQLGGVVFYRTVRRVAEFEVDP